MEATIFTGWIYDHLPECHMAPTAMRERRRVLRYGHLLVRQMTQTKNRVSGLLMETGVEHNRSRLHKVGYFRRLNGAYFVPQLLHLPFAEILRSEHRDGNARQHSRAALRQSCNALPLERCRNARWRGRYLSRGTAME
jgi:hypothetical protein